VRHRDEQRHYRRFVSTVRSRRGSEGGSRFSVQLPLKPQTTKLSMNAFNSADVFPKRVGVTITLIDSLQTSLNSAHHQHQRQLQHEISLTASAQHQRQLQLQHEISFAAASAPAQRERSERAVLKVKSNINNNIFLFTT
jgi:hypothetical protein